MIETVSQTQLSFSPHQGGGSSRTAERQDVDGALCRNSHLFFKQLIPVNATAPELAM
jgi:hypothetical protein